MRFQKFELFTLKRFLEYLVLLLDLNTKKASSLYNPYSRPAEKKRFLFSFAKVKVVFLRDDRMASSMKATNLNSPPVEGFSLWKYFGLKADI